MRKLAAIFMLVVFAFNVAGYQLLYNYLLSKSDATLELALDQDNYSDEELITIKQPTNLPYYSDSKEFQRIDGEVEMDGIKYKYVKCRIHNGYIEMLCIPNKKRMQIEEYKNDYAKIAQGFAADANTEKKNGNQKNIEKAGSEYEELQAPAINTGSRLLSTTYVLVNSVVNENRFTTSVEQPPDAAQTPRFIFNS